MSTYINVNNPKANPDYHDAPALIKEYIIYMQSIQNRSARTINGYYIDLRTFYRFILKSRGLVSQELDLNEVSIFALDVDIIKSIKKADIYEFLHYCSNVLGNTSASRARKTSSLKGFYKYLTTNGYIKENPTQNIEVPTNKKRLPKYLSLEESIELLKNINSDFLERDYCIFTLFLNCGMRLSELVGININDFKEQNIRIVGKGNKERLVYLNNACIASIKRYLDARAALPNITNIDKAAMFISKKTGNRLSPRRVQQIVDNGLKTAGLSGKGYSTHKLRHTAATLMYRFGDVDMLALKEILGHEHVSTTEIYTHISTQQLQKAVDSSPLAKIDMFKKE